MWKFPKVGKTTPISRGSKDMDARRTKKNGLKFFGYKNHAKVDGKSKVITNHDASSANVHDSQKPGELLDKSGAP